MAAPTRKSPLKVFRTAIGFHDAYVAAPSRKAALKAWGTGKDLFGRGIAEVVTDPKLTAEALASPGQVIRKSRGDLDEQLANAGPANRTAPRPKAQGKPPRRARPKPRPSRTKLAEAETTLAVFKEEAERERRDLHRREDALRRERVALERKQAQVLNKLTRRLTATKQRYEWAMEHWRSA